MEFVTGISKTDNAEREDLCLNGSTQGLVRIRGMVHTVRDMKTVSFVLLRLHSGLVQCVAEEGEQEAAARLKVGTTVEAEGRVSEELRAPGGFELRLTGWKVLWEPEYEGMYPLPVAKQRLTASPETKLNLRPVSLRNLRERAVFKLQEGLVRGFREFLYQERFTEIHTPKIVAGNAEGGANVFRLDYFGKKAFLAQSPQFYKQMMVGVFDRVFETAPVFRAEKHNTTRHLNEYTSLDLEMGYIDSFADIMALETSLLRFQFSLLKREYARELELLSVTPPEILRIPAVRFDEAKRLVSEKYHRTMRNPYDLEPEEEQLIGRYFKEEYGSDFVFVTHYPSRKRPFYAMDDPKDKRYTLSFDLLFDGMEVTTGGQRIHSYREQVEKMRSRGMNPEEFEAYLMIHKYGMPPHGGLGIGLERLTMKLIGKNNVRETTLFPRDVNRLEP